MSLRVSRPWTKPQASIRQDLALPETHWFSSVLFHFLCKEFKVNSEVNSNESGVWFEENLIRADSKLHSLFWTSPTCNSLVVLNFTLLPSVSDQNLYLSVTSTGWIVFMGKNLGCLIEAKSPASAPRLQPHVTRHQFDTFDFLVARTSINTRQILAGSETSEQPQIAVDIFQRLVLVCYIDLPDRKYLVKMIHCFEGFVCQSLIWQTNLPNQSKILLFG